MQTKLYWIERTIENIRISKWNMIMVKANEKLSAGNVVSLLLYIHYIHNNKSQEKFPQVWEFCNIFQFTKDMTNFSINFSNLKFHVSEYFQLKSFENECTWCSACKCMMYTGITHIFKTSQTKLTNKYLENVSFLNSQ